MKKVFLFFTTTLLLLSCNNNEETIQYELHMSHDKEYEVDIPVDFEESSSFLDMMLFSERESASYLQIEQLYTRSLYDYANEKMMDLEKFSPHSYSQTDSSIFYKTTGGTLAASYDLFMTKKLDKKTYIIHLSSVKLNKEKVESIIKHVQKSMVAHSKEMNLIIDTTNTSSNTKDEYKTRNTNFYSIKYPTKWDILENPDEMTDVFIGNNELGFTVLFFDTDVSLSEINEEGNTNMRLAGAKVISNKKMSINGQSCYKSIYEFNVDNMDVKQISYTFKKKNTMYNVKFGNDKKVMNANNDLIEEIINSFKIK